MNLSERSSFIKLKAQELGFLLCGISKAQKLDLEAERLKQWLGLKYQGSMTYMENHFEKRIDPTILVPGAKSIISLAYNYFTPIKQRHADAPKISMYAYGKDYHKVIRKKLERLLLILRQEFGDVQGRGFVDSAPILERDWAKKSGLGWIGKNTLLIHPKKGSFFFLAEIIVDLDFLYDHEMSDYCGTCTRCIDACPTDAISPSGYVIDGSKCISYLTIESKEEIPDTFAGKMDQWMFGCDVCQSVCPWNKFASPHNESDFIPKEDIMNMSRQDWQNLTEETFNNLFEGSAVKRTKFLGLQRNIAFLDKK